MNLLPHSGQKIEDYIRSAHKYLWYLDMKRIKQYECDSWPIKFSEYYDKATDSLCPSIVIPLINIENKIRSVEYIYNAKGICRKQFKKGGEKRGNFYPLDGLGRFYSPDKSSFSHSLKGTHVVKQLYIAEGYATAASLFESLQDMSFDDNRLSFNYHMIVAFDASNICPVVGNLRTKFPTQEIIICADDDEIGHKAANKACQMYNCRKFIT